MKTEYHIIWVDDEIDSVETDITDVELFFEKFGIEAIIKKFQAEEENNIHEVIKSELNDPELDMLVVDFKMDGMNGKDLIASIRETDHVFLPVIFYSSAGPDALHKEAADASLDGVYIADRSRIFQKVQEVATSLLRKEQTVKRTRGLLMEGVSEIDARFGSLFTQLWAKLDAKQRDATIAYLRKKLAERAKGAAKAEKAIPSSRDEFLTLMRQEFVSARFDTMTRWKMLKHMLETLQHAPMSLATFLKLFEHPEGSALVPMRNDYGHKTRIQLEGGHTEAKCVTIRKELREQTANIERMILDTKV